MKEIKEEGSNNQVKNSSTNWVAVLWYLYINILGIVGLYYLCTRVKWLTVLYFLLLTTIASMGLTVGAHRLYAHQSFLASWHLRFVLVLGHTLAGVGPLYNWVFWHRIHHKYYSTERDPYNHKKGFLHAHVISNLLSTSQEKMDEYVKDIDMRDIEADGFVWTQRKFYWILFIIFGFLLTINVPMEYWNESLVNSLLVIGAARLAVTTNISWLVNSAMLIWGLKEGDKYPVDDNTVFFITKSYWLNYHYVIPWDWKNDEFGSYNSGFMTFMLKIWNEIGLVTGLQTANTEEVRDALYKVAISEMTMKDALREMKYKAEIAAEKESLACHH